MQLTAHREIQRLWIWESDHHTFSPTAMSTCTFDMVQNTDVLLRTKIPNRKQESVPQDTTSQEMDTNHEQPVTPWSILPASNKIKCVQSKHRYRKSEQQRHCTRQIFSVYWNAGSKGFLKWQTLGFFHPLLHTVHKWNYLSCLYKKIPKQTNNSRYSLISPSRHITQDL